MATPGLWATSGLVFAVISCWSSRCVAGQTRPKAPDQWAQDVLDQHNLYRCMHAVPLLEWSDSVQARAQSWLDKKKEGHSSFNFRRGCHWKGVRCGENLYSTTRDAADGARAAAKWYREIDNTQRATFGKVKGIKDKAKGSVGHYTQVVWKQTTHLGCATQCRARCSVVCQYSPTGNFGKEKNYLNKVRAPSKSEHVCRAELGLKKKSLNTEKLKLAAAATWQDRGPCRRAIFNGWPKRHPLFSVDACKMQCWRDGGKWCKAIEYRAGECRTFRREIRDEASESGNCEWQVLALISEGEAAAITIATTTTTTEPLPYHLAPVNSSACDYGVAVSKERCQTAVVDLARLLGQRPEQTLKVVTQCGGGWSKVPLGCSTNSGGDWIARYQGNVCPDFVMGLGYQVVCTGPPTTTTTTECLDVKISGNYSTVVKDKTLFLKECSDNLRPATCVDAQPGSVIVTASSTDLGNLVGAASAVEQQGFVLPSFGNFTEEVLVQVDEEELDKLEEDLSELPDQEEQLDPEDIADMEDDEDKEIREMEEQETAAAAAADKKERLISAIFPDLITVNVPTMLTFEGAMPGDKAAFVASTIGDCSAITSELDVGAGHAMFTLASTGDHMLCYRFFGAQVLTSQPRTLRVKAPGVTPAMVGRWQSKSGAFDCSDLTWVPYCGVSREADCPDTYEVQDGIGYKCSWKANPWPGQCTKAEATDSKNICKSDSCSNGVCW